MNAETIRPAGRGKTGPAVSMAVAELLADVRPGFSLPGGFYTSDEVFEAEYDAFIGAHWIMAGHVSQLPATGDYFTFDVAGNALIIVWQDADRIAAFHNVCRHRGAQICEQAKGSAKRFYCRYHAWTYNIDGTLARWRHMPDGLDKADYGLVPCAVAIFEGMIFVSLNGDRAPDFATLTAHVGPRWSRFALADCEVAAEELYVLQANWKLGIENNLECYHCMSSHPEFTAVNAFVRSDEKASPAAVEAYADYQARWTGRMEAAGLPVGGVGILDVGGQICRATTGPIAEGFGTGSRGGKPVAPLLGDVAAYDESATTGCIGFHSYIAAMSDYALSVTYVPQSASLTHVHAKWFVRKGAKAGVDYDPAELRWLWDETTKQDKDIIELNARGVTTRGYQPGPYSTLEGMTADFVGRYVALMASWSAA